MKRLLTMVVLASFWALPNSVPAAEHGKVVKSRANSHRGVTAPADEYFGPRRYSILGIRNTLHDLNIRYDGSAERTPSLYSGAAALEDAMRDWGKKYRGDLWLAHYLFQLDQLYMRVPPKLGHAKVASTSHWIIVAYPNTYYGRYLKHIAALQRSAARSASPKPSSSVTPSTPLEQPTSQATSEATPSTPTPNAPTAQPSTL